MVTRLLGTLLGLSTAFDAYAMLTEPEFAREMGAYSAVRMVCLVGLLLANRFGWTSLAAFGAIMIVPAGVTTRLVTASSQDPARTLAVLVLTVVASSVLFGELGTVVAAAGTVALLVTLGVSLGLPSTTITGLSALSVVVGALLVAGLRLRRALEEERQSYIHAEHARQAAVLETALDCIVSIDNQGRIIEFNPAAERLFGHRREDVLGKSMAETIVPPRERDAHRAGLARFVETGEARVIGRRIEVTVQRADGSELPCELAIAAAGSGADLVFIAHLRDLTERREADERRRLLEEQLRESQKMQAIGQLAGGIAHDFNNTLHAVGGYLSFALEEARLRAPEIAADIEAAERATQKAAGFVRQLLAFARRQPLDLKVTSINDLVAGFLPLVRRAVGEGIHLDWLPGVNLPAVSVDESHFQQVVLNLCLNSRDAMPEGGTLALETELVEVSAEFAESHAWARAGRFVALLVVDSGRGMTAEVQQRMFEPFFTTKGPDRGTGLGLAVVYGFVEQHQGFIRVDSAPGAGTAIRVYLPAAGAAQPATSQVQPPAAVGGTETILIADDADAIRDVTRRTLSAAGYRVLVAVNGDDAVEQFERSAAHIDLVVLDAIMPRRTGREAYHAMRAIRPDLPAIFVSGYASDSIDPAWLAEVGAELAAKPTTPDDLLRHVRRVLDTARSRTRPRR